MEGHVVVRFKGALFMIEDSLDSEMILYCIGIQPCKR